MNLSIHFDPLVKHVITSRLYLHSNRIIVINYHVEESFQHDYQKMLDVIFEQDFFPAILRWSQLDDEKFVQIHIIMSKKMLIYRSSSSNLMYCMILE